MFDNDSASTDDVNQMDDVEELDDVQQTDDDDQGGEAEPDELGANESGDDEEQDSDADDGGEEFLEVDEDTLFPISITTEEGEVITEEMTLGTIGEVVQRARAVLAKQDEVAELYSQLRDYQGVLDDVRQHQWLQAAILYARQTAGKGVPASEILATILENQMEIEENQAAQPPVQEQQGSGEDKEMRAFFEQEVARRNLEENNRLLAERYQELEIPHAATVEEQKKVQQLVANEVITVLAETYPDKIKTKEDLDRFVHKNKIPTSVIDAALLRFSKKYRAAEQGASKKPVKVVKRQGDAGSADVKKVLAAANKVSSLPRQVAAAGQSSRSGSSKRGQYSAPGAHNSKSSYDKIFG